MATNLNVITDHPAPEPARGFPGVGCLLCGAENSIAVQLVDCSFLCSECGNEISLEDARKAVDAWTRVLSWVALAAEVR